MKINPFFFIIIVLAILAITLKFFPEKICPKPMLCTGGPRFSERQK